MGDETSVSFVVGWVLLGLLIIAMGVLFAGVVRYLLAGRRKPTSSGSASPEYRYEATDEDDDSPDARP